MAEKEKGKGKKGEFEKMGDLDKGVGDKKESTDDIIKEIESFDATKNPPPGGGESAPEGTEPESADTGEKEEASAEKKKDDDKDFESLKKELEREKEKGKNLAKIIEKVSSAPRETKEKVVVNESPDIEPKLKEIESKLNENVESQMKEVKDAMVAMGTRVQEASKNAAKPERTSPKIKDMIDKVQADTTSKITEIQETLKALVEKAEAPKKEEDVSKGLASIGGGVDLKNQLLGMKSGIKDMEKSINELRDETDTRITRIKEQLKVIEKIPAIEEKLEGFLEKMSPGNIEKMKKFIFSADEITGELIPNEIEKKVTKELTPVFNDIKGIRDDIEKANENIKSLFNEINFFKTEIKTLYKFGDYISSLQKDGEKLKDAIEEKGENLLGMVNKLEELIKKRTELAYEKIEGFEEKFDEKLEGKVKDYFEDLSESKILEVEDRTEKNLAVSRAKVNDMVSKFVQFQNVVNPTISLIKDEIEKLNSKFEKLKNEQTDLEEEVEDNIKGIISETTEPRINEIKQESSKVSESVNGRLDDFESEFVQFQNVINPTLNLLKNDISKIDVRIEKLNTKHDGLKGNVKELENLRKSIDSIKEWMKNLGNTQKELDKSILVLGTKLGEIREEFNSVVKQTVSGRKKLEEESKKEKDRINILLKELKGS